MEHSDEWVTKVAESGDERLRLGGEAAVLRAVAHPAIVRLADVEGAGAPTRPDRLRLHRTRGPSLAETPAPPEEVAAGWGAAVATVIGDLHDLGFVHGAIEPEHVLIDEHGRPIVCGLGHARRVEEAGQAALEADVRAVARLVAGLLGPGHDGVRRLVRQWETGRRRHRSGARAFAKALVHAVPEATVMPVGAVEAAAEQRETGSPGPPLASNLGQGERRRHKVAALGALGLAVAGAIGWLAGSSSRAGRLEPSAPPVHSSAGVTATGPSDGYVLRSGPGEHPVTVVGRWGCGPARPAVLDTASGAVWTFAAWPSGTDAVRATFVERVAGASGLAVVSDGAACDDLVVIRSGKLDQRLPLGRSA